RKVNPGAPQSFSNEPRASGMEPVMPTTPRWGRLGKGGGTAVAEPEVLDRLRAWDRKAGEAFVDAHYRGVYGFFLWLTNDRDAAADLTQETFAAFWETLPDLEAEAV